MGNCIPNSNKKKQFIQNNTLRVKFTCDSCQTQIKDAVSFYSCKDCVADFCETCVNQEKHKTEISYVTGDHKPVHTLQKFTPSDSPPYLQTQWNIFYDDYRHKPPVNTGGVMYIDKPVIYLYAPNPNKVHTVTVYNRENVTGDQVRSEFVFSYPTPKAVNKESQSIEWELTTNTSGQLRLVDKSSDVYPYLFWDAKSKLTDSEIQLFQTEGLIIDRENYTAYLEKALHKQEIILASEVTDFITHWVPQMLKFPQCKIQFNKDIIESRYQLTVSPAPDVITRVFMVWQGLVNPVQASKSDILFELCTRNPSFTRVVEWGGTQLQ